MQTKRKKIIKWILVGFSLIVLFILVFLVFIFIMVRSKNNFDHEQFNSEVWKHQPEERYKFVKDLSESDLLKNSTKTDITERLGPPDTNEPVNDSDQMINGHYSHFADTAGTNVDYVYYIGTEPGILKQVKYLFIWFDENKIDSFSVRGAY